MLENLKKDLQELANPEKAKIYLRFFKTGPGEYGEGDNFLGLTVPQMRGVAKKYYGMGASDIQELLNTNIHEYRLVAIFILLDRYKKDPEKVFIFYLKNTKRVNNWDLVDLSAHKIVGDFLIDKDRKLLYDFAKSDNLWERRISIISCFAFIKDEDFKDAIAISEMLLGDKHDLIHKAVGWVLREIGKKDVKVLRSFLSKHHKEMPRTMLRYSIEKFDEKERKKWLGK